MALGTATELKAAIGTWMQADDLGDRANDFISLAEARFNRDLRTRAMETDLASTALVDGAVSLPTGFLAFKEVRNVGDANYTLQPKPLEWICAQDTAATGGPRFFAVTGSQIVCWPAAGSIRGTYFTAIPSLTSEASNWLLTAHPDLYLFACLEEGAILTDDQRGQLWGSRAAALIRQIQARDDWDAFDGGVLAVRAR